MSFYVSTSVACMAAPEWLLFGRKKPKILTLPTEYFSRRGGIGAIIDHNKGNGYNYPDQLSVVMGKSVAVDRKDQGAEVKPQEVKSQ